MAVVAVTVAAVVVVLASFGLIVFGVIATVGLGNIDCGCLVDTTTGAGSISGY